MSPRERVPGECSNYTSVPTLVASTQALSLGSEDGPGHATLRSLSIAHSQKRSVSDAAKKLEDGFENYEISSFLSSNAFYKAN